MFENKKASIYMLIAVIWCNDYLLQYIRLFLVRLPLIGAYAGYFIPAVYSLLVLLAIPHLKVYASDLVFMTMLLVVYCASPVLYPETSRIWSVNAPTYLVNVIPFYFLGSFLVEDVKIEKLLKLLYRLAIVSIFAKIIHYFVFDNGRQSDWVAGGAMGTAYSLLPYICLGIYYAIRSPNVLNWGTIIISSIFLLFLGNRGSILILVITSVLLYLLTSKNKLRVFTITSVAILIVVFVFSPVFEVVVEYLERVAENLGMSVRIFEKLEEGSLADSNGRDAQAENIRQALRDKPIGGLGLYGDRVLNGTYAHSIYREMWVDFGYLGGTLVFMSLIWILVKAFMVTTSIDYRAFLLVLMSTGFFKLFFSGSYLLEDTFYYGLGLAISMIRFSKRDRRIKNSFVLRCYL